MSRSTGLIVSFVAVSSSVVGLLVLLVWSGFGYTPQQIITTCGLLFESFWRHVHFNPIGVVWWIIWLILTIGVGLAIGQVIGFVRSVVGSRIGWVEAGRLPEKLTWVAARHDLGRVSLLVSDDAELVAYTAGLLRPRIVVSRSLVERLSREELEAVVLHEAYHVSKHHVWWLLVVRVLSSGLFFVPVIGYLAGLLRLEFELASDSFVVRTQQTRRHISKCLIYNLRSTGGWVTNFATYPIESRVENIVAGRVELERMRGGQLLISLVGIGLLVGGLWLSPVRAEAGVQSGGNLSCLVTEACTTPDCITHGELATER